jgi:hypothetical protein
MIYSTTSGEGREVQVRKPDSVDVMVYAIACDTDAGWYDEINLRAQDPNGYRGFKVTRKVEDFDVFNLVTGQIVHRIRHAS